MQLHKLACSFLSLHAIPLFVWAAHKNFAVLVVSEITKRYWIRSSSVVNGLLEGSDRSQPLPVILIPCLSIHPSPLFTLGEIRASLESFPWLPSSLHPSNNERWPPVHPCQGQLCRDLSERWQKLRERRETTWVQPGKTGGQELESE